MTDNQFLDYLYHLWRDSSYQPRSDEYIQSRAKELIDAGEWSSDELDELKQVLREATDPYQSFRGQTLENFRDATLRILGRNAVLVDSIPVGLLPSSELNAFAVKNPNGGHVVVLNSALDPIMQLVFQSFFSIETHNADDPFDNSHHILDHAQSLLQIADSVGTGTPDGVVLLPTWDCHDGILQDETLLVFAEVVLIFVLLHEYGHIVLNHLDGAMAMRKVRIGNQTEEVQTPDHQQEFEADQYAIDSLLNHLDSEIHWHSLYAIGIFFRFLDLCEFVTGSKGSLTHPPSSSRWNRIKDRLSEAILENPNIRNVDTIFDNLKAVSKFLVRSEVTQT